MQILGNPHFLLEQSTTNRIEMEPIVDIFPVPPLGCNCSIVADPQTKKAVVVDPGGSVDSIVKKLESQGLTLEKIFITHGHLDHVLCANELKERMKNTAAIIMHQDDLSMFQTVQAQCRDFGVAAPDQPLKDPDAFIADNDVVQVAPNFDFKCLHCPGHTPGSTSYYCQAANIVFPGDTLFKGGVGRTSWDGIPSLQGTSDAQQEIQSITSKLMTLPEETIVVCGHGSCTTVGQEKANNPYIRAGGRGF
jgi:glyoxylase-like metal-dependent hydrolase (beta-lactamase superfamily II)